MGIFGVPVGIGYTGSPGVPGHIEGVESTGTGATGNQGKVNGILGVLGTGTGYHFYNIHFSLRYFKDNVNKISLQYRK